MRKEKSIFLFGAMIVVSMLLAGCFQSASDGTVATSTNDQLGQILGAVASQEPVNTTAPTQDMQTGGDTIPSPEVATQVPTETPTPEPTIPPINVDKTVPKTYALHDGEFPWCIARRFNLNPVDLLNANGIPVGQSQFSAGLVLTIPNNIGPFEGNRALRGHTSPYNVKTGDTFYSVACYFGDLWPEEIAAANNMDMGDSLPAGTQLVIP